MRLRIAKWELSDLASSGSSCGRLSIVSDGPREMRFAAGFAMLAPLPASLNVIDP